MKITLTDAQKEALELIQAGFTDSFSMVELWQFNTYDKNILKNKRLALCFRFGMFPTGENILVNVLTKEVYRRF
ncbi:hypothetical protein [Xenorhabdus stockiae]|uniref:hypothetical protein n=1 Tax=Xenorhabdus stockiae TaxID=351614 RepID=UPI00406381D8